MYLFCCKCEVGETLITLSYLILGLTTTVKSLKQLPQISIQEHPTTTRLSCCIVDVQISKKKEEGVG